MPNYVVMFKNDATVSDIQNAVPQLKKLGYTVHSYYTGVGCVIVSSEPNDERYFNAKALKGVSTIEIESGEI